MPAAAMPPQDYNSYEKRFIYVDGYHGKKPWKRFKINELDLLRKEAKNYNVFATVQQFCFYKQAQEEEQYLPLYFDLDAAGNLENAKQDAIKLRDFFYRELDLSKSEVRFYFSGSKGFHIFVNPISLGVKPNVELTYVYKNIAFYLKHLLRLETLDPVVYTIRRVMRLNNSIHGTSGLFKIELDPSQLEFNVAEIRTMAKKPLDNPLYESEEYEDVNINEHANALYNNFYEIYKKQQEINKLKPQKIINKTKEYPVCVKDLLENNLKRVGDRNNATMCLACYFKDQGYSIQEANNEILPWAEAIPENFTSTKGNALKSSTLSCIKSIYDDKTIKKQYHFICTVMRSLEIKCDYDRCEVAKQEEQEPERIIDVDLSEASDGSFIDKKIRCKVMVVGKDTSPFLAPKRVQFDCKSQGGPNLTRENSKCKECSLATFGGMRSLDLPTTASFLIETIQCPTQQQLSLLKKIYVSAYKCEKLQVTIQEYRNIEEVELNPSIELQRDDQIDFVMRRGYFVGSKIDANQEYKITGQVVPDPRTQQAVHIFDQKEESETSLSSFKMTGDLHEKLKIFQVKEGGMIKDKLNSIYDDLERNILHIWQRRDMILAMDLVYHSALKFKFHGDLLTRGWLECFILGDSGQAKSIMFSKLSTHYNLGIRISGEGARRTGLAWTWRQLAKRWIVSFGIIPNNDKRLVCIDEAGGMDAEQLEKLTDLRESGIADATGGPVPAKTYSRTRLIFMSNAKSGQPLRTFIFPVYALTRIFTKSEDIRRLDFALAVMTGEIDDTVIHVNPKDLPPVHHTYTSDLSHQLVLWAWTRKPDDIIFTEEAELMIKEKALYFGKNYTAKIPLVESTVMRIKLARMSVAIAARLFSTNNENNDIGMGEQIIVKKEHVEFIAAYLNKIYGEDSALGYFGYTINNRLNADGIYEDIIEGYKDLVSVAELNRTLLTTNYWSKSDLRDMLGYDPNSINNVIVFLHKNKLIEKKSSQFKLTIAGVDFVKRFDREIKNGKVDLNPYRSRRNYYETEKDTEYVDSEKNTGSIDTEKNTESIDSEKVIIKKSTNKESPGTGTQELW